MHWHEEVSTRPFRIMNVDDEVMNLSLLESHLEDGGYESKSFERGIDALRYLEKDHQFDAILLDRMMPDMDGMVLFERLKSDEKLKHIPVIMQTALSAQSQMIEGMNAGIFHYLKKPFNKDIMLAVVKSAAELHRRYEEFQRAAYNFHMASCQMDEGMFSFSTLVEANSLAHMLSSMCPEPEQAFLGFSEILINAVEHGNLEFSYEDKKRLLLAGEWQGAITDRLNMPAYAERVAQVHMVKDDYKITVTISDEGKGFNHSKYMELNVETMEEPNGRGIALANLYSFDEMVYNKKGNQVVCTIFLTEP